MGSDAVFAPALLPLYESADNPDVSEHLAAHQEIMPVLVEAAPYLRDAFGAGAVLRLEPPYARGAGRAQGIVGLGHRRQPREPNGTLIHLPPRTAGVCHACEGHLHRL